MPSPLPSPCPQAVEIPAYLPHSHSTWARMQRCGRMAQRGKGDTCSQPVRAEDRDHRPQQDANHPGKMPTDNPQRPLGARFRCLLFRVFLCISAPPLLLCHWSPDKELMISRSKCLSSCKDLGDYLTLSPHVPTGSLRHAEWKGIRAFLSWWQSQDHKQNLLTASSTFCPIVPLFLRLLGRGLRTIGPTVSFYRWETKVQREEKTCPKS